jgi:GNAT superfamily N-acetyltransferase
VNASAVATGFASQSYYVSPMPIDPRVPPVEDNILFFVERICREGPDWVTDSSSPFAAAYWSDVPFPLFNLVAGARVGMHAASDLTVSVANEFIDRGLPWMWWTTPSYTNDQLEHVLDIRGLEREDTPGMYADLDLVPEVKIDVEVAQVPVDDRGFGETFIDGFGLPALVLEPMQEFLGLFSSEEQVVVVALVDGQAVGVATGLVVQGTIGIYNVTTSADHRGRGIGTAVTGAVMRAGRDRGCTNAILHTSPMGRRVYERLGFEVVCPTTQWVWTPSAE